MTSRTSLLRLKCPDGGDQAEAFCDLPQRAASRNAALLDSADNTVHYCLQKERICTFLLRS